MYTVVVGGNFGDQPKESSVAKQIAEKLNASICVNGGEIQLLHTTAHMVGYDLMIWGANVDNGVEKIYPHKPTGAVLICTKILREDKNFGDAVSRIYAMSANAVIAIDSSSKPFKFTLIDALGNNWCSTTDIGELITGIMELYSWTIGSVRVKTIQIELPKRFIDTASYGTLDDVCAIVKIIADKVENERGGRYFGNVSTRCAKLFPSVKLKCSTLALVSARNTPKDRLTKEDFVYAQLKTGQIFYEGEKKPSVDTPVQLQLYNLLPNINFMIHGHAYIENAAFTKHYYPCGDLRELDVIRAMLTPDVESFAINLKNHGFLIGAKSILELKRYADTAEFKYRNVGEEKVK